MRLTLAAVGRLKAGPEKMLYDSYAQRMAWPLALREVEERRKLPAAERMAREADLLLAACPADAALVALDRRGKVLDSDGFARWVGTRRDTGAGDLAFLIGGAEGHPEALLKRCALVLSFGPMTFPHMLARILLIEQLYRAQQILAGHPYHRA
ncbi:23S rRNA (pseudouridine(1915)-N(3))-methyltransferase RlmH [Vineibacter terrae]|uniref:Ribosomal RNA large subunit methyltransferase H n=1 Tax=Vineibacter terrae TaxID=2586908 RepID=A0A5C8PS78_9HYPH|nr:23S rRNA (pseudouridine(1915)-N(3))-methyltransferase RlmH [Vineibacter terrae]TXL78218.1 23S rRNA (pseudouridine(1915)-N(3))-methyltransferase RlmH [Vineibacter terrae]